MALMAFSDFEVYNDKSCSKTYLKNYKTLKKQCDDMIVKLNETEFKTTTYKRGLATVEDQLVSFRKNEVLFSKEIIVLKREVGCKDYEIGELLESQITDKSKKGLGYNDVSPPHPLIYNRPTKLDLSYSGLDEFKEFEFNGYGPRDTVLKSTIDCDKKSDNSKENTDDSLEKEQVTDNVSISVESPLKFDKETVIDWKETIFHTAKKVEFVKPKNNEKLVKKSVRYAEMYRSQSPRGNQRNWNGQKSNQLGSEFVMYNKASYSCGSFDHVQINCPHHQRKRMVTGKNLSHVFLSLETSQVQESTPCYDIYYTTIDFDVCYVKVWVFLVAIALWYGVVQKKPRVVNTTRPYTESVNTVRENGVNAIKTSAYIGCSRHMTGNITYLSNFKEFDGGYVTFGGGAYGGRISSKASKDETSEILKNFIKEIENLVDKKVKIIRSDNGTEFKNKVMDDFCREKSIKMEYSVAKTPQQNGVAERRNKTLIEAARTMLADSKLPTTFWAEAVTLSFMRSIGCHVTILNTLDSLGKFDGKSDEGFFVGYSLSSKAFRVYNTRTRRVEENLHIGFLENKPMIEGNGSKWLFDIDSLTQSMNYVPVAAGTIINESDVDNGEPKSTADDQKQIEDGPDNENDEKDKYKYDNSPKEVNTAGQHVNTASPEFLNQSHTRIHKDHPIKNVIGDVKSSVQTRRMTKPTSEQGFLRRTSAIQTLTGLDTCGFAYWKRVIRTKWVFRNKKDERGIVIRNKARLVAQELRHKFVLAYASFMGFLVYQMDVKSAFLYGTIEEEVYVTQPPGFKDPDHPDKVYKVVKALYGLHQAPRACSTNKDMCTRFEKLMKDKFQMSSMGELTFFLGLQVQQKEDGIFISQDKYVDEILKKFNYTDVKSASTPVDLEKPLVKDGDANDVDVHLYRSMIGSLMYLTASRPDIIYLKGKPTLGLWYSRDSPFELVAYTDSDYAGATQDRKSTTRGFYAIMITREFRFLADIEEGVDNTHGLD
ncbi:putative ribonuclease H-like domain-containing protein [Tanacetum coccineum]